MQLSSRILTALAVLILAVAVVAVRAGSPGTVEAATGDISVLNVGTCYTTNTDAFAVGDCDDGDGNLADSPEEGYNVAGRDSITAADSIFATYSIDPKTSGDQPRAILENADLIKISIEDKGRDKRTGKIYAVSTNGLAINPLSTCLDQSQTNVIIAALDQTVQELKEEGLIQTCNDGSGVGERVQLSGDAYFVRTDETPAVNEITSSGDAQFRLTGGTNNSSTMYPMAPDGDVTWFGVDSSTTDAFEDLDSRIDRDEDYNPGVQGSIAPWMRVTAALPADTSVTISYIYYQTSEFEELVGGATKANYVGYMDAANPTNDVTPNSDLAGLEPVFFDEENAAVASNQDALTLRVSSDGDTPTQNLWLKEAERFSGVYEGYVRITDADGNGSAVTAGEQDPNAQDNWGLATRDADNATDSGYAVIGVESGPVTITYKNSNGDTRSVSITIDKDTPTIQVDSPIDGTSSTDDSPELIGTFTDGGGSGLREDSFKIYADNTPSPDDANPIWDLGVLSSTPAHDRGLVCVDAIGGGTNKDLPDGMCDLPDASVAVLRSQYAGYDANPTYGILKSEEIYLDPDEKNADGEDLRKTADAEDFEDGDVNGEFDTIIRIDFPPAAINEERYNDIIDIQAVVIDVAGNIGFSDADPSSPTFIHDLGTTYKDRSDKGTKIKHNVLGVYSRHTYYLDDVDPYLKEEQSATGFFIDADGDQSRSNSGLMVVFDGPLDPATVGIGTFTVKLDGGSDATVIDAAVDNTKVYLLLEEELAPDATPSVDLASGQSIADLAGNESTDRRLEGIELSDGILPTFTITLSGGTGLNEDIDGEGPSELTNSIINLSIAANEAIQGAPQFAVVCHNLHWDDDPDETSPAEFASNRTGAFTTGQINDAKPDEDTHNDPPVGSAADIRTMCADHKDPAIFEDAPGKKAPSSYFDVSPNNANRRAGNNWHYDWSNLSGDQALEDGKLTVIVWGRDRSSYLRGTDRVLNYSASTVDFEYDAELMTAWDKDGQTSTERELVPGAGEDVFEVRPFVLLDFGDEDTTVDVTTFEIDGTDYTADLQAIEDNEFVWWPEPLAFGTYEVYVEANDAANNTGDHTYSFTVKERSPFVIDLLAGWNAISFPANPVDRALHAVFTNPAVDQVIGWNVTEPVSPWRMATRVDGVWTTSDEVAALNDVEARYGYWVHSQGFITQAVKLAGKGDRSTDGQPHPADIPTDEGWNFVGVVDVDGDQTQDNAGESLRNSDNNPSTAAEYLGNYTRAYTWDHINNTWDVLNANEDITIGSGIWVYYTSGHDIAP